MVFQIFSSELQKLISRRFEGPTPAQLEGIPHIHRGENVLLIAETGLGKTEAVLLPIFDLFLKGSHMPISILYITPLKALNRNLLKRILWWAQNLGFEVSVRHGDTTQYERGMQAQNPADMFITTPETLQAMLTGKLMREHLRNVRFVVVDEVHELVDNKRGIQLSIGLERLKELIKKSGNETPQIIGLSATIGSPEQVASFLTAGGKCRIVNTAKVRGLKLKVESPEPSKEDFSRAGDMFVSPEVSARLRRIDQLIRKAKSVLAFTNTRESSEVLSSRLKAMDSKLPIETHHSSLSRDVRVGAEEGFKAGKLKALVCTSSLELGIDIGRIDLILQYMSPRQVVKILQRAGRSGHRLDRISDGVIVAGDSDDCFESCVIARLALKGRMEETRVYQKALDVLGHQIVGLSMDEYKIPAKKAFEIVRKAYPYRDLEEKEFLELCLLLQRLGYLWLDTKYSEVPVLKRRKGVFLYYYSNLSTIADVKHFKIIDILSNQHVGTLDAEFIALHGSPGTSFIVKGQAWRIIQVERGRVLVEPQAGIEAAIPAWEGELIPVPREVAQNVGKLRKEIENRLDDKNILNFLTKKYPVTKNTARKMAETARKQRKFGFVPGDRDLLFEYFNMEGENYLVIHSCFGSLINETLGRALTALLIGRLGSVGLQTDPYRIMLKIQRLGDWKEVLEVLQKMKPEQVKTVLEVSLQNTELFNWRFLHVAQRLGIISRDADFGKGYLKKIVEAYAGTPAYREALNEILQEKLDLKGALDFLKLLKEGKLTIKTMPGLSPLSKSGLIRRYEIVAPLRAEREIFSVFKKRLLDTRIGLVCTNCGGFGVSKRVRDVPEKLECPRCGAKTIAIAPSRYVLEAQNLVKKALNEKNLSGEDKRQLSMLKGSASMVMSSGKGAVKALAGRGIGPRTAGRILARQLEGDDLLREILNQEKIWARTKRFWRG